MAQVHTGSTSPFAALRGTPGSPAAPRADGTPREEVHLGFRDRMRDSVVSFALHHPVLTNTYNTSVNFANALTGDVTGLATQTNLPHRSLTDVAYEHPRVANALNTATFLASAVLPGGLGPAPVMLPTDGPSRHSDSELARRPLAQE